MAQIILGTSLNHPWDGAGGYYRSRPFLLSLGLSVDDALAGPMGKSGGFSDGRDIGVVCNLPDGVGCKVLPMSGGVGTQYTPTVGWAQALQYRTTTLQNSACIGAVAVALGGDGSVATNGFWSALNIATTLRLPYLLFIEDNGFGLSVPSTVQTPGGNIAKNLSSFPDLLVLDVKGYDPLPVSDAIDSALQHIRNGDGPALLRVEVPRLSGHSGQDNQAYKSEEQRAHEQAIDPLPQLQKFVHDFGIDSVRWDALESEATSLVHEALQRVEGRPDPDPSALTSNIFYTGTPSRIESVVGLSTSGNVEEAPAIPEGERINMALAIRRTIDFELSTNPKFLLFGEDVGAKGGVHAVTLGLQEKFGSGRVFDTTLSEEGIIGRALGMSYAGLFPMAEIQFRKYADPAQEHLNDIGTVRWRTNNRFACPLVVRLPGGFAKCGDPWHSESNEVQFAHAPGWQVAMPSNAEDAVGLLRFAMRDRNPTLFFEHRNLLDAASARRPYPGDDFVLPFGRGTLRSVGDDLTIVTWGTMVGRVEDAQSNIAASLEVIDLRTLSPWDEELVLRSVEKTGKLLVVHEDRRTAGFGAEISAVVTERCFFSLRAPVARLAVDDIPLPYSPLLLEHALPSVANIVDKIYELLEI